MNELLSLVRLSDERTVPSTGFQMKELSLIRLSDERNVPHQAFRWKNCPSSGYQMKEMSLIRLSDERTVPHQAIRWKKCPSSGFQMKELSLIRLSDERNVPHQAFRWKKCPLSGFQVKDVPHQLSDGIFVVPHQTFRWKKCCPSSGFQMKEMSVRLSDEKCPTSGLQVKEISLSVFQIKEMLSPIRLSDERNFVPHQAFRWKNFFPSSGFQDNRNVLPLSGSPCLLCVASLCGLPNLWTLAQGDMVVQSDITCSQRCHVKHSWTWWWPFGAGCWTCEHLRRGDSGASHAQTCSRAEPSWAQLTSVLGWPSVKCIIPRSVWA